MEIPVITKITLRRFLLGKQGLWPGRRWRGKSGVVKALQACQAIQLDPLNVTGRSQEIALHGRVLDFKPEMIDRVAYAERRFFDYGGLLFLYPMEELPYWRVHMSRVVMPERWQRFLHEHADAIEYVRAQLRERGPVGNRELVPTKRVQNYSYRGGKDTSLVMYYLWITGEVMIHHRKNFARIYALREQVAPAELDYVAPEREAEEFFARKAIAFLGLAREQEWRSKTADFIQRAIGREEARTWLARLVAEGTLAQARIEGEKETHYLLREDLPLLETVAAGGVPRAWKPLEITTEDEVSLLAPLEIVSTRGRAKKVFDFDYLWEVYKPAQQRRWGYYTLPVLYGDDLVARIDPRLDREAGTLRVLGFWPEPDAPARSRAFKTALERGLDRFAKMLGESKVDMASK